VNLLLLSNPQKSASAASTILDEILTLLKYNLCMKTRNKLIRNWYLIIAISAHCATFVLKGIIISMRDFALFDNELILLVFIF